MKPTVADALALALASALVGALFAAFWRPPAPAAVAEIRRGDRVVARYALDQPRALEIPGALGPSQLLLEPGRARFVGGPCRNRVCVHFGWLRHDGDVAACLPNGITLALLGGEAGGFDALSY